MRPKVEEKPEELISILRNWQKLENATITHTTEVISQDPEPSDPAHHGDHPAGLADALPGPAGAAR